MNLIMLPNDILYHITSFLSAKEKIVVRESCIELYKNVDYMQIRIERMNSKIEKLQNGRMYILCRLRLAALCGLHQHTVASIWSWITSYDDIKIDALPLLRQISRAIYVNNL